MWKDAKYGTLSESTPERTVCGLSTDEIQWERVPKQTVPNRTIRLSLVQHRLCKRAHSLGGSTVPISGWGWRLRGKGRVSISAVALLNFALFFCVCKENTEMFRRSNAYHVTFQRQCKDTRTILVSLPRNLYRTVQHPLQFSGNISPRYLVLAVFHANHTSLSTLPMTRRKKSAFGFSLFCNLFFVFSIGTNKRTTPSPVYVCFWENCYLQERLLMSVRRTKRSPPQSDRGLPFSVITRTFRERRPCSPTWTPSIPQFLYLSGCLASASASLPFCLFVCVKG